MKRLLKAVSVAALMAAAPAAVMMPVPVMAQGSDPAVAQVTSFYDALTAMMKSGGTTKSRYEKLKPAAEKAFDFQAMIATAVGPTWASASDADKKALTDAFEKLTVATYAKSFDSYTNEKFPVEPASIARGTDKFVKSKLVAGSETHAFIYRMHQVSGDWKITDVLLEGSISQMAQKRSDFAGVLASGGPAGLAKRINALADQTLG
jgi:phospholipid transport system substrate-binding protein